MMANFKKVGVAAAVATAIGASSAAYAVQQGTPGDALLIPYVVTAGAGRLNTMISVVAVSPANVNVGQFNTLTGTKTAESCNGRLHWFFFDKESNEVADNTFAVTCNDWVGLDFGTIVEDPARPIPSALNVPGYMVITDNAAGDTTGSGMILYGAAYQIRGNWATQAYIPVVPLVDSADGTVGDEVDHVGAFVANVNPVKAGMALASGQGQRAVFSLRYYLKADAPAGDTEFVLWFPDNNAARVNQNILVYDADERAISATTNVPYELNVIGVGVDAKEGRLITATIRDGLSETGFVAFGVADGVGPAGAPTSRAGVAFSLIGVNGGNGDQTQTELAHERGVQ